MPEEPCTNSNKKNCKQKRGNEFAVLTDGIKAVF
jgi:hypothetical protein